MMITVKGNVDLRRFCLKKKNNKGAAMMLTIIIIAVLVVFTFSLILISYNLYASQNKNLSSDRNAEAANSLSPGQAIKLMFLHKQMRRLREGLSSLAKDVPASLGDVLTSCSEDVSTALNRLEQEIGEVEILAEDEQIVKLKEIVELLKKHAKGEE